MLEKVNRYLEFRRGLGYRLRIEGGCCSNSALLPMLLAIVVR